MTPHELASALTGGTPCGLVRPAVARTYVPVRYAKNDTGENTSPK